MFQLTVGSTGITTNEIPARGEVQNYGKIRVEAQSDDGRKKDNYYFSATSYNGPPIPPKTEVVVRKVSPSGQWCAVEPKN